MKTKSQRCIIYPRALSSYKPVLYASVHFIKVTSSDWLLQARYMKTEHQMTESTILRMTGHQGKTVVYLCMKHYPVNIILINSIKTNIDIWINKVCVCTFLLWLSPAVCSILCWFELVFTLIFVYISRADQFDYVMYGKVYKIEGDETSTEAATRLWV